MEHEQALQRSLDYPAVRDLLSVFRFQSTLTDLYEKICSVVIKSERDPHKFRVPCGDLSKKTHLGARCPFSGPADLFARSLDRNRTVLCLFILSENSGNYADPG